MRIEVNAVMTQEQLREYEAIFNDDLNGAERHRPRFLPTDPEE